MTKFTIYKKVRTFTLDSTTIEAETLEQALDIANEQSDLNWKPEDSESDEEILSEEELN